MDPNNNPTSVEGSQPVVAAQQNPTLAPQQPTGSSVEQTAKPKSKIGLIVGCVIAVLLLLGIGFFVYNTFFSDAAKTKRAANAFAAAITSGDKEKVYELAEATDEDKPFLSTATDNVKGSYKLKSSTEENGTWHYLYDLTGGEYKSARVTVEKQDGKWKVAGFVYDKGSVGEKPDTKSEQPTSSTPATSSDAVCMDNDDFKLIGGTFESDGKLVVEENFFFKADSAEYEYTAEQNNNTLNEYVQFANANSGKDYEVVIAGSINTGGAGSVSASDRALANQRAEKVRSDLVAKGFPSTKVRVDEPEIFTEFTGEHRRNVDVVTSGTSCGADAGSSDR